MSEATQEKEIEVVQGTISAVTQKKADTWQVEVTPNGSQYTKKLWTKDAELVQSLSAKLGQAGAFVCGASYWTNQSGAQVRSLWINGLSDGTEISTGSVATPESDSKDGMTKEEWARKDRAGDLRACIAIAAGALQHTVKSEPSNDDLNEFVARTLVVARQWHNIVTFERAGDEVPFLSEHDESIPF